MKADQKIDIRLYLAGWAGEAYLKAHKTRDADFNATSFCLKIPSSGYGSGWPCGLFHRRKNDIRDLIDEGLSPISLSFPLRTILQAGRIIHEERDLYWRLMAKLTDKYFLSAKSLIVVSSNDDWTAKIESDNECEKIRTYSPNAFK